MSEIELLFSQDLSSIEEDENYIYANAVFIKPTTIDRYYGKLKIEKEEIEKAKDTLKGKPVLIEHRNEVDYVIGQVIETSFSGDGELGGRVKIIKKDNERLVQLIKDKIVRKLSVGFERKLVLIKEGLYEAKDIKFEEVSIVLNPAIEDATILRKEDKKMQEEILNEKIEALKKELALREETIDELKKQISVFEKEIEGLKQLADIGKKYEEKLKKEAEKFVKIVEGEDTPILSLIDRASIDELEAIVQKYETAAREKLKSTAASTDGKTGDKKEEFDIQKADYTELVKLEEQFRKVQ